jgi:hypothetical protein
MLLCIPEHRGVERKGVGIMDDGVVVVTLTKKGVSTTDGNSCFSDRSSEKRKVEKSPEQFFHIAARMSFMNLLLSRRESF